MSIGFHFKNDCPIDCHASSWLIALGVTLFILVGMLLFSATFVFCFVLVWSSDWLNISSIRWSHVTRRFNKQMKIPNLVQFIFALSIGLLICFILSGVFYRLIVAFHIWTKVQFKDSTNLETYCHPILFSTVFIISTTLAFVALILFILTFILHGRSRQQTWPT